MVYSHLCLIYFTLTNKARWNRFIAKQMSGIYNIFCYVYDFTGYQNIDTCLFFSHFCNFPHNCFDSLLIQRLLAWVWLWPLNSWTLLRLATQRSGFFETCCLAAWGWLKFSIRFVVFRGHLMVHFMSSVTAKNKWPVGIWLRVWVPLCVYCGFVLFWKNYYRNKDCGTSNCCFHVFHILYLGT